MDEEKIEEVRRRLASRESKERLIEAAASARARAREIVEGARPNREFLEKRVTV